MTKDQRVKAMGQVIQACAKGDDKVLADAVRKIVADLQEQERQHKVSAAAEHTANLFIKGAGRVEQK